MSSMQKEDLLKAAQNNGDAGKEAENAAFKRSVLLSEAIMMIVCLVMFFIELGVKHTFNIDYFVILTTGVSVQMLFEGIKTRSVWKIIVGAVFALVAVFLILACIGKVLS